MSLTGPEILDQLELNRGFFPREAVEAAIARREEMVPELLRILDQATEQPERLASQESFFGHIYALYLLAQFREPEAYPRVIRFFSLPGEVAVEATGDVVTEDLDRILASLSLGDVRPIQQRWRSPKNGFWNRRDGGARG